MQRLPLLLTPYSVTSAAEYSASGMTDFHNAGCFVSQSSRESGVSSDVGRLIAVKTEGICKNIANF